MKSILFVCTGNTCRSPMAEALFRAMMSHQKEVKIASAGLHAADGFPASSGTTAVLKEQGIDMAYFESQLVTGALIKKATHIFAMTQGHLRQLVQLYPEARKKTFLLTEGTTQEDIPDPIGGSLQEYRHCCANIKAALENISYLLQQNII